MSGEEHRQAKRPRLDSSPSPNLEPKLVHETNRTQRAPSTTASQINAEIAVARYSKRAGTDPFADEDANDAPPNYKSPPPSPRDHLTNYIPPNPNLNRAEVNFYRSSNPEVMWLFHVRRLALENLSNCKIYGEESFNDSSVTDHIFENWRMTRSQKNAFQLDLDFAYRIGVMPWQGEAHARSRIIEHSQEKQRLFDEEWDRLGSEGNHVFTAAGPTSIAPNVSINFDFNKLNLDLDFNTVQGAGGAGRVDPSQGAGPSHGGAGGVGGAGPSYFAGPSSGAGPSHATGPSHGGAGGGGQIPFNNPNLNLNTTGGAGGADGVGPSHAAGPSNVAGPSRGGNGGDGGGGGKIRRIKLPALTEDWYPGYFYYLMLKARWFGEHPRIRAVDKRTRFLEDGWDDQRDDKYSIFRLDLRRFDWHAWAEGWGRA
ncbi:hypothetical protein AA313_de0205655 [Arthrobotrys entomopaga]|nr:hypothetical protein AA313_de0205655 [Arthrobotrys entomopaga]